MNELVKTIYTFPVPITAIDGPPQFRYLSGRRCEILCRFEDAANGTRFDLILVFHSVVALKIVGWEAVSLDRIELAYGEVVDFGETEWLSSIRSNIEGHGVSVDTTKDLRHVGIYFDEGPLFEFVCGSFEVAKN